MWVRFFIFVFLLCGLCHPANALDYTGTIIGVHDGDTVTLLTPHHKQIKIRLANIDAPELKQPYGMTAKQTLSNFIFQKHVIVTAKNKDRYGRTIGTITRSDDHLNINTALISVGAVWVYRTYAKDPTLIQIENTARNAGKGLWSLNDQPPVPPWDWRKSKTRRIAFNAGHAY